MCKTFQKQRKFPVNNVDMLLVFLVSRCYIYGSYPLPKFQVTMVNKKKSKKGFSDLGSEDLDLTMFTITDLTLNKEEEANMVFIRACCREANFSKSLPWVFFLVPFYD